MIGSVAGTAVNIVLNPLFIHGFGWGAAGSAGAFVLSISRQGVMLAITLFVGSRLAGYQGVIAAQAIADLLTAIVAVILFVVMLPELRSRKAR